jgi:CRP/FNR family transcriptional regulator
MKQVPNRPTNLSVIESCGLLAALDATEKQRLAGECSAAHADRGDIIWLAGAPAGFVGVLGAGFVKMTKNSSQGAEIAIELLGPGQCIGVLAAIEGRPLPLTASAVTGVWYLRIPTHVFLEIYNKNSAFKDQVVRSIGPRLRKAHDMMSRLSSGRVAERMAAVMTILMDTYGERRGSGVRLTVPLTRQDLAELTGTTVETAIRVMSRWQKEGVISTERQIITVLREDVLGEAPPSSAQWADL